MQEPLKFMKYLMHKMILFMYVVSLIAIVGCNNQKRTVTPGQKVDTSSHVISREKIKTILFFGNSLTAGYGVDPSEAFPALIQNKIDSLRLNYTVINAGVSGETSSGGNSRVDWILRQPVDIFVLELGGNDGLRGIPLTETKKNLQAIIDKVRAKYPAVKLVLAGMQIPPNMGQQYAREFASIYPELAAKNKIVLIPFLLEGVGGEVKLNQEDGIHPTPEGHKIVAQNVWKVLKSEL
jgi:acyl-CoA thioesterase I